MLLLLACAPRAAPPAEISPELPQPAALFEAHLAAIGGAAAVRAQETVRVTGAVHVEDQGIIAPFVVESAAPADVRAITEFPGGLTLQSGVHDGVAWARDPGARWRLGEEAVTARRRAALHRDVHYADGIAAMSVVAQADFHGVPAFQVALDYAEGADEEAWFSVETGLLIGRREWGDSEAPPEEVLYEGWTDFDGVLHPTRETRWMEDLEMVSVVDSVAINGPVDTSIPDDLAPPPGPDVVLPLTRWGSHVVLPVSLDGAPPETFLLDTGANATVLDDDLAAALGLGEAGLIVPAGGAGGAIAGLRLQQAVPMTIGGRTYPAPMVAVLDLSGLGMGGVLGADFLAWHTVDVDPGAGQVRLTDALPDVTGLVSIPVERFSAGLLKMTVTVAGQPVVAMLDLGADVSVLSWRAANLAGLAYGDGERDGQLLGADGRSVQLYAAEVPLSLGALDLGTPRVSLANLDALSRHFGAVPTALIGQDLLAGRRVVIDYAGGHVYLSP